VIGDKTVLPRNKEGEPRPFKFRQRIRASSKSRHLRSPVLPWVRSTPVIRAGDEHTLAQAAGGIRLISFSWRWCSRRTPVRTVGTPGLFWFPARSRRLPGAGGSASPTRSAAAAVGCRSGEHAKTRGVVLTGLDSLTASERRVAELTSHGHRNREVAQTSSSRHPRSRVTSRASSASSTSTRAPSFTPRLRVAHRSRRSVPTRT
jgi:hypothetical protein